MIGGVSRKMVRRHPHVFGTEDQNVQAQEVPGRWEAIKKAEKQNRTPEQETREKEALENASGWVIGHLSGKDRKSLTKTI